MTDRPTRRSKKTDVELRAPSTDAGEAIVESILIAAEHVLERDGLEGFTTNHVAERAGVSVGSLYQYFPNKHAVLAELARRLERRTESALSALLETSTDASLHEVTTRVVDALCTSIGGFTFRRALLAEVPGEWTRQTSSEVDRSLRTRVRELLVTRGDIRAGDPEVMAWVVSHVVETLIETAVRDQPSLLDSAAFRSELVTLVTRYLVP
ncbi:MAG: TetR/AcrR family transcriptional regulator [Kofleriaceae bacterium]